MQRTPWLNLLIVLLVIIAALYLAQMLWQLASDFAGIILLFVLAWLVSFALSPLIEGLENKPLAPAAVALGRRLLGARVAHLLARYRTTRLQAVAIIYLALVLILVELIAALVPPTIAQLNQLATQFPSLASHAPELANTGNQLLQRLGLRVNVQSALLTALGSLQNVATPVMQNVLLILTGVVAVVGNLLIVLILSFFFALDGPRLFRAIFRAVPESISSEVRVFAVTVDRTFGGFIRAQLLQALAIGIGTMLVMTIFAGQFVLVTSVFAGLFMLIPFVGPVLALVPPLVAALLGAPNQLLIILILLIVYQTVIVNVLMPKLLSDALGLHPLVVIGALLVGVKVGGFWGAFFGVPVAGVIATMALFFYRRWMRRQAKAAEPAAETAPGPETSTAPAVGSTPALPPDWNKGI